MVQIKQGRWSLKEMLADMRRQYPDQHTLPRDWAAQLLKAVGDEIAHGNSYSGFTHREVGWALVRVFGATDTTALSELVRGYQEAQAYYGNATLPDDLNPEKSVG